MEYPLPDILDIDASFLPADFIAVPEYESYHVIPKHIYEDFLEGAAQSQFRVGRIEMQPTVGALAGAIAGMGAGLIGSLRQSRRSSVPFTDRNNRNAAQLVSLTENQPKVTFLDPPSLTIKWSANQGNPLFMRMPDISEHRRAYFRAIFNRKSLIQTYREIEVDFYNKDSEDHFAVFSTRDTRQAQAAGDVRVQLTAALENPLGKITKHYNTQTITANLQRNDFRWNVLKVQIINYDPDLFRSGINWFGSEEFRQQLSITSRERQIPPFTRLESKFIFDLPTLDLEEVWDHNHAYILAAKRRPISFNAGYENKVSYLVPRNSHVRLTFYTV